MKKIFIISILFGVVLSLLSRSARTAEPVYVISIEGEIEKGLVWVIRRGLREAEESGAGAIILHMDTNGGRADATQEIMELLNRTDIPTYTYVDTKAFSAGAYIAVATDHIYMAPASMIGAATPIAASPLGGAAGMDEATAEKMTSAFRAMIAATAEQHGHPVEVVEAMVDRDVEIPGIIEEGKLLTLTGKKAESGEVGLSEGIAESLDILIEELELERSPLQTLKITPSEQLARFITGSMVTVLLLMGGLAGIYFEIRSPGFGLPGILGISCLALFFFGHYIAGLAGYEELLLFIVGAVLLFIEIFITPGFGLLGGAGILCLAVSLITAMARGPLFTPPEGFNPDYGQALMNFGWSLLGLVVIIALTYRFVFVKSSPFYGKFVLTSEEKREEGYDGSSEKLSGLMGKRGAAITRLRPAGKARIDGRPIDVVSRGAYLDPETPVEVIEVRGNRVVVKKVAEKT